MTVQIFHGDCREVMSGMEAESIHCVVTSPPYWGLRDYGVDGQLGMEPTPDEYIEIMVGVFREVRRVLRKDGTLWLNMGDCYAGSPNGRSAADTKAAGNDDRTFRDKPFSTVSKNWRAGCGRADGKVDDRGQRNRNGVGHVIGMKPKDLCMMPARLAIALQDDGWWVRSEIIWHKPNPMPESVTDRPATAHEKIFLLTKSARYFYDAVAVRTPSIHAVSKMPDGWDTGPGSHGTIHRQSREKGARVDKQRGHRRRHAGFNDRWDQMERDEQIAGGANLRNVWTIATQPFTGWTKTVHRHRVEVDDVSDDTKRITSPDCPAHGGHLGPTPNFPDDGHEEGEATRTGHNDDCPAQGLSAGSASTVPRPSHSTQQQTQDSRLRDNAPSAMRRSSETRKTDPVPATNQPCTPSAQTACHIADTLETPDISGSVVHKPESNSEPVGSGDHPSVQTACRTVNRSSLLTSCTCEFYQETTKETSHFATFPTKLVEPCIKAGCPKDGVVLDPFGGAGTVGLVAERLGRDAILIELNAEYADMARARIRADLGTVESDLPEAHAAGPLFEGMA